MFWVGLAAAAALAAVAAASPPRRACPPCAAQCVHVKGENYREFFFGVLEGENYGQFFFGIFSLCLGTVFAFSMRWALIFMNVKA